jgi:hypothetical protein
MKMTITKKKWFSQTVPFLAADDRSTERINYALNKLEEEGWFIEGVEMKGNKGYGVFILASKEVEE